MERTSTIVLYYVFIHSLVKLAVHSLDNCPNINYIEQFYRNKKILGFCSPEKEKVASRIQRKLAYSLEDWHFNESQILFETFPLDKETGNFVREVRNVLFSYVKPTALKSRLRLAGVSSDVLQQVLDMEPEHMFKNDAFLEVSTMKLLFANCYIRCSTAPKVLPKIPYELPITKCQELPVLRVK